MNSSLRINDVGRVVPSTNHSITTFPCPATGRREISEKQCVEISSASPKSAVFCTPHKCACPWRRCIACILKGELAPREVVNPVTGLCQLHTEEGVVVVSHHSAVDRSAVHRVKSIVEMGPMDSSAKFEDTPQLQERAREFFRASFGELSSRDVEILALLVVEPSTKYVATTLGLQGNQVDAAISHMYSKLKLSLLKVEKRAMRGTLIALYRDFVQSQKAASTT